MRKQEVIEQLESLIANAKSFIFENGDNEIWEADIEALNEAIRAVNEIDEIDNLKREVIYHMKRAQDAEMLLREVQPYCLQEDRNKISEFFKK
jgi:hypothetical protein